MTQEDKELLLKDLSARLLYGVKVTWDGKHPLTVTPHIYCAIVSENNINNLPRLLLRPMSSMTKEERKYFQKLASPYDFVDALNANHFDYRGLIEKNLALDCTGLHVYD